MLFVYLIILLSLVLYTRFFIINSLRNRSLRRQTLHAVIRALYFLPIFQQGLFLFCISLIYCYTTCKGFFLMWDDIIFFRQFPELRFLVFASFVGGSGLLLCFNFMLAKISMNTKIDTLSLVNKFAYLVCSAITLWIVYMNLPLLYPNDASFTGMVFYDDPYIIITVAFVYLILMLLPFFYHGKNKNFRYLQLSVRMGITYFVLCFILAALVFIVYAVLKLTV